MKTQIVVALIIVAMASDLCARDKSHRGMKKQQRLWVHSSVFLKDDAVGKAQPRDTATDVDVKQIKLFPKTPQVQEIQGEWVRVEDVWIRERYLMLHREAVEYFTEKTQANPDDVKGWRMLSLAWSEENECGDKAISCLDRAIELEPNAAEAYVARAELFWVHRPQSRKLQIRDLEKAIQLEPGNASIRNALGLRYCWAGNVTAQIKCYSEAIKLDPADPSYFYNRRMAWMSVGDVDKAFADAKEIFRYCDSHPEELEHHYSSVYNDTAWTMATWPDERYRDGKQAVEYATKACQSTQWNRWRMLGTLAAAYAESGDFENAVRWAESALQKLENKLRPKSKESPGRDPEDFDNDTYPESPSEAIAGAKRRLELYQSKRPYRDPSPYNEIAWYKACSWDDTYRNGKDALEFAKTACELTDFKNWQFLDTLATAYAETGEFAKAIETEETAIKQCPEKASQELKARLELFRTNKPYRQSSDPDE